MKKNPILDHSVSQDQPKNLSFYRQALLPSLSSELFKPNPARLIWYGVCISSAFSAYLTIVLLNPVWPLKVLLGLIFGFCNGTLGFLCHELSHGSILKNKKIQTVLGFLGTIPLLISPTYWRFSHNRLHHGKTQKLVEDPDAFPTLRLFRGSRFMKFMFPFTPGSGHKRSISYFFFWFSFHNVVTQVSLRFKNRAFDAMEHRRVTIEFYGQLMICVAAMVFAGAGNWFYVLILPFFVQNYLLMSYISTNHNLSPLTSTNDPLANSLSVSNHPILEFLNLNFGYHVEHHIFPTVNGKHMKTIQGALLRQFPIEYKIMTKSSAMKALYSTPRIYKNSTELIHPETGSTHSTV